MKLAAGDLVGNDHVKPAYVVDSSVRTIPHPPLYIANPIRFDTSGNLDAVSQAAVKSAADLMIAAPRRAWRCSASPARKSRRRTTSRSRRSRQMPSWPSSFASVCRSNSSSPRAAARRSDGRQHDLEGAGCQRAGRAGGAGPPRLITPCGRRRLAVPRIGAVAYSTPSRTRTDSSETSRISGVTGAWARRPTPAPRCAGVLPRHLEHGVLIEDVARTFDRRIEVDEGRRIGRDRVSPTSRLEMLPMFVSASIRISLPRAARRSGHTRDRGDGPTPRASCAGAPSSRRAAGGRLPVPQRGVAAASEDASARMRACSSASPPGAGGRRCPPPSSPDRPRCRERRRGGATTPARGTGRPSPRRPSPRSASASSSARRRERLSSCSRSMSLATVRAKAWTSTASDPWRTSSLLAGVSPAVGLSRNHEVSSMDAHTTP